MKFCVKLLFLLSLVLPLCFGEKSEYDVSFEELAQMTFSSIATLTKTETDKVPVSVTVIDHRMIEESGTRNLDELLEIYVSEFHL